ncbi:MAG: Gfo/Idh/MocA family oxidoreductase [Armatimonadota bacterium]|nr:Gfo/Idh/MocA family oxidoreductase [Armatimonadota bacterium]
MKIPDNKVKWGILGCANIVRRRFMPGMSKAKNACVVAIASREESKAKAFADELGIPRAYGSYDRLLDDPEIEAVYIPLPNWLHAEWTIRAAAKGKHVLCEKPLATNEQECRQMAEACRAGGVLLMEGFMYRFHPRTIKAKQIATSGMIGEVKVVRSGSSHVIRDMNNIRLGPGGGAIMDVGCYCVNAARYFFDAEPIAVYGRWRWDSEHNVDMTFAGLLEFPGDRFSIFDCSFEHSYRQGYELIGTGGALTAQRGFVPGDAGIGLKVTRESVHNMTVLAPPADQFALEIDHFSDCIRNGKPVMLKPEIEAVANMRVIDALKLSAKTGERVKLTLGIG